MDKRHQALEPLMFIDQPTETTPQSTMQQTYSSLHEKAPPHNQRESVDQTRDTKKRYPRRYNRNITYMQDIVEGEESTIEDVRSDQANEVEAKKTEETSEKEDEQTFTDLSLEEKVIYCTSTSSYIPNITCVMKTEKQTVVGIIGKYEEGIVHILPQRSRVFTEIPLEEIISIRMAGF